MIFPILATSTGFASSGRLTFYSVDIEQLADASPGKLNFGPNKVKPFDLKAVESNIGKAQQSVRLARLSSLSSRRLLGSSSFHLQSSKGP